MENKHTKGPWEASTIPFELATKDSVATIWKTNLHEDGQTGAQIVADISKCVGYEQALANAHLIAAAPEMLEALERFQNEYVLRPNPDQVPNNIAIERLISDVIIKAKNG